MFDASDGLFHLVFADKNDDRYTTDYLKLRFVPFLRDSIVRAEYSHIYIFGRRRSGDKSYLLQVAGAADSKDLLKPVKKSIFSINLMQKKQPFKRTFLSYDVEELELTRQEILLQYTNLLAQSQQNRDMAIVIPADMFAEFGEEKEAREALEICRKKHKPASGSNIIVITFSLDPEDNDAFLCDPSREYIESGQPAARKNTGIFMNSAIFPEIESALYNVPTQMNQLVFRYDELQGAFGERMVVWDNMSLKDISAAIHYFYLHNAGFYEFIDVTACANMIWAWYRSPALREKYNYLNLPSVNTFRLSELIKYFSDPNTRLQILEAAEAENASDTAYILEKYGGEKPCIISRDKTSPFVTVMIRLRNLIRTHADCLDKEEKRELLDAIDRFGRPSFPAPYNFKKMTLEGFAGERREITRRLLDRLTDNAEWNMWDKAAVRILFLVIRLCCLEADLPCDIDSYHLLESVAAEKSFEAIAFCLEQSKNCPFKDEEAVAFANTAEEILSISADGYKTPVQRNIARERIKNWRV